MLMLITNVILKFKNIIILQALIMKFILKVQKNKTKINIYPEEQRKYVQMFSP